jgi:hypothetical protein
MPPLLPLLPLLAVGAPLAVLLEVPFDFDSGAEEPIGEGSAGTDANSFVHRSSLRCFARLALFCLSVYRLEHYYIRRF